ncbi:MAG: tRNA (adenosine(37)-N6)-dimethylallyltransferase MiaA [candidate division Zixibacteria bacterium]|nr:tRNA (adenosine(37)-N6)-dimethylallyltransferase MiaA [candidate division Zixibacteria bacterium]
MKYIIICGPTASGKTGLGVGLALRYNGEVINADSRQIYKHTTIGTAKPAPDECGGAKHHLLDFLELDEDFSAYKFAEQARGLITDITGRGKLPLVVGGTGLYLKALTEGIFKAPEHDKEYRRELEEISRDKGPKELHEMLQEIDPKAAAKIKPRDAIRLIRALETFKLTGLPISEMQKSGKYTKVGNPLWLGLMFPRKTLYERINKRVDTMIDEGFEQEVLNLKPYLDIIRKKKMIGYMDMITYLFDRSNTKSEAIDKVKQHHRNYAKRQMTWFRNVAEINWIEPLKSGYEEELFKLCDSYLKKA